MLRYGQTGTVGPIASKSYSASIGLVGGTTRTQAGATALPSAINRVDTSTAPATGSTLGDGVLLPPSSPGAFVVVWNNTANPIQVYGNGSDTINGVAGATGVPQNPNSSDVYWAAATGGWAVEAGVGFSGRLPTQLSVVGITAGTTRTQAGATALPADINRVDTSTAPAAGSYLGDGVLLPASAPGLDILVWNNTNNPIQVYPSGTDTVNGVAGATGVGIPPNCLEIFVCPVAGAWVYDAGVGFSGQLNTVTALSGISAAGTNQATATGLVVDINRITTATAGQGVRLPASAPGIDIFIINKSAVNVQVYGNGSDTIDGIAGATGVPQMPNSMALYTAAAAGAWDTEGLATGYAGNGLQTLQFADSITAAGTTQATATQLSAAINNVTTVASGTGVNLPASSAGLSVVVQNNGANALQVYPFQGATDTINGQAATVGVVLLPGAIGVFNCTTAGAWVVQPASSRMEAFNAVASATALTLTAANITGGVAAVELSINGAQAGAITATLPTVAAMVAALHAPTVGTSYRLRIVNSNTTQTVTVATNTGWTVAAAPNNTLTIATATWRDFTVTLTSLTAATLASVATGTFS